MLFARLASRDRALLDPFLPFTKLVLMALYSLPPLQQVVFSAVNRNVAAHYEVGDVKYWWAFHAMTHDMHCLVSDVFRLGQELPLTIFVIRACNAYDVRSYSAEGTTLEAKGFREVIYYVAGII